MDQFFQSIYSWFCNSSQTVFKIMQNIVNDDGDLLLSSMFPTIGITTAIITLLVAFAFYIWPINHPRFKAWWAWLIMLFINAAINFGLGFAFINHRIKDIHNEKTGDAIEIFTEYETLSLPVAQWMDFSLADLCVSIMFFIIASLILNWFSTNCRFSPFRN